MAARLLRLRRASFARSAQDLRVVLVALLAIAACSSEPDGAGGGGRSKPKPGATPPPAWVDGKGELLAPLPAHQQATTSRFSTHDVCAQCHSAGDTALRDEKGRDVSPVGTWKASPMALAARDPYYLAVVAEELAFRPGLKLTVERTCTRCHAPEASVELEAEGIGPSFATLTTGTTPEAHLAREGVACTGCHQIADSNLGTLESFSGAFVIEDARLIYGPYKDPRGDFMRTIANYSPTYGAHVSRSALCATCHTVITRPRDAKGNVGPNFPEQTPYLEWAASAYATEGTLGERSAECQDCHMPSISDDEVELELAIAKQPDGLPRRKPFRRHGFAGANVALSRFGASDPSWFGANVTKEEHEAQARSAEAMLRRAATVEAREVRRSGDGIELVVSVANQSGHKFPTGYPSRRAFLHVLVTAPDGRVVFESGKTDAYGRLVTSTGALAEAKTFHPHLDVVDREDLVQIYESVPVENQGKVAHRPLDALRYAKDNRLLPVGFDRRSRFSAYISPVGTDADPGWGHEDTVTYRIPKAPAASTIVVELLFQVARPSELEALAVRPTPAARRLFAFADAAPLAPVLVARAETRAP